MKTHMSSASGKPQAGGTFPGGGVIYGSIKASAFKSSIYLIGIKHTILVARLCCSVFSYISSARHR